MCRSLWSLCDISVSPTQQKDLQTKIDSGFLYLCMFLAKHNDDQTEEDICHNHGNALLLEAANAINSQFILTQNNVNLYYPNLVQTNIKFKSLSL